MTKDILQAKTRLAQSALAGKITAEREKNICNDIDSLNAKSLTQ